MEEKIVYLVHAVDAEGPLYESFEATFERIENAFGFKIKATLENLEKLQNKELPLYGKEDQIAKMISKESLKYNADFQQLNTMLATIGSAEFRNKFQDSFGNGWIYNWFCVDHIGYTSNPRKKELGFHKIFDFYKDFIKKTNSKDSIHWHFHPVHPSGVSNLCATNYLINTNFFDIIAKRILEREWFPSVNRAGFNTGRADSHWLLEQWIPFDISNQSYEEITEQDDLAGGRFGDWRRAPLDWRIYNPNHDDYQSIETCRRYIGRCLNVGTRIRNLTENEVVKAFEFAQKNGKALMGVTNHDFREMSQDISKMHEMLSKVSAMFPNVKYKFSEAREAFNTCLFGNFEPPQNNILNVNWKEGANSQQKLLEIEAIEETFGPQPFLAIKTRDGMIYHDNLDIQIPFKKWTYVFDYQTVLYANLMSDKK